MRFLRVSGQDGNEEVFPVALAKAIVSGEKPPDALSRGTLQTIIMEWLQLPEARNELACCDDLVAPNDLAAGIAALREQRDEARAALLLLIEASAKVQGSQP
jgi:hypothetical protein